MGRALLTVQHVLGLELVELRDFVDLTHGRLLLGGFL